MFQTYQLEARVFTLTGGIPKDPARIASWLRANAKLEGDLTDAIAQVIDEQASVDTLAHENAKGWQGFKEDDHGLYIEARQLKAMLKEGANILKEVLKRPNFKSKVAERVFTHGVDDRDKVYLERDGAFLAQPDRSEERAISVMTMQGPRTALKRADQVDNVTIRFLLSILDEDRVTSKYKVTVNEVAAILAFCQQNGLGADRSQGSGQFHILSITRAATPPMPTANDLLAQFRS